MYQSIDVKMCMDVWMYRCIDVWMYRVHFFGTVRIDTERRSDRNRGKHT
jgi:hypothetical protein